MPEGDIYLQPKQRQMYALLESQSNSVIGVGGGRGSAKSSGGDRCALKLMYKYPGVRICLVMRTWVKQMVPFHLKAIRTDFPWLAKSLKESPPAELSIGRSRMEFKYAEGPNAVEEAFRSGNYDAIIVDQAEQFTWRELIEMRKAARSRGGRKAKLLLIFNMRGASIQELRKVFYLHDVTDPEEYAFLKINPWDNVEWVRYQLQQDGYTVADYYGWTDEQRKAYAAAKGPYTRQLAHDDPVIAKADWEGDWDSLEGSYFANSFDLESVRIGSDLVERLRKPWATHWSAQDWGKAHYCVTFWFFRIALSPAEALNLLGWTLVKPINVTVLYREMIVNEMEAAAVGQTIADCTPDPERKQLKAYFLSPEEVTDDPNSIGAQQSKILRGLGMPGAVKADNDRKGGYGLMASMFQAAKGKGWGTDKDGNRFQYDDVVLASVECVEALNSIPLLLRNPKDLDDVLKTDLSTAKLEQDCGDTWRYGLKSMLAPKRKSEQDLYNEQMDAAAPAERMMLTFKRQHKKPVAKRHKLPPSWRGNLR